MSTTEEEVLDRYENARIWYSKSAKTQKRLAFFCSMLVIAFGALTSFLLVLKGTKPDDIDIAVAAIGVAIAVLEGWNRIGRFDENWLSYRAVSEAMKSEHRLFLANAGVYATLDTERKIKMYAERAEALIREENKSFLQDNSTD